MWDVCGKNIELSFTKVYGWKQRKTLQVYPVQSHRCEVLCGRLRIQELVESGEQTQPFSFGAVLLANSSWSSPLAVPWSSPALHALQYVTGQCNSDPCRQVLQLQQQNKEVLCGFFFSFFSLRFKKKNKKKHFTVFSIPEKSHILVFDPFRWVELYGSDSVCACCESTCSSASSPSESFAKLLVINRWRVEHAPSAVCASTGTSHTCIGQVSSACSSQLRSQQQGNEKRRNKLNIACAKDLSFRNGGWRHQTLSCAAVRRITSLWNSLSPLPSETRPSSPVAAQNLNEIVCCSSAQWGV